MTYLRFFLGSAITVLALVGVLNFVVDPANVYRARGLDPQAYAEALISSKDGLWNPDDSIDERSLAKAMSAYARRVDCVVVGSSRVMQVSSERVRSSLSNICPSILNLGVSAGSIEDHFVMVYLTLQNDPPKRIILGIDPWSFSFSQDERWSAYRDDYLKARAAISGQGYAITDYESVFLDSATLSKLVNLINLEYMIRSIRTALSDAPNVLLTIAIAPKIDPTVGGKYPVRLRDGSLIYSAKYMSDSKQNIIPIGGTIYKTSGKLNQLDAINAYRALLLYIKNKGVEPILLMTPYHENVLKAPTSPNATALRATEPIVLSLAQELGLKVVGSYDPKKVGCLSREFYDFMHPTSDCLAKVRVR